MDKRPLIKCDAEGVPKVVQYMLYQWPSKMLLICLFDGSFYKVSPASLSMDMSSVGNGEPSADMYLFAEELFNNFYWREKSKVRKLCTETHLM